MLIHTLDKAAVGLPITRLGVSFMPIYLPANKLPKINSGLESRLKIDELEHASVPTLMAYNPTDTPILIVEGEHFIGGKQNRTLNTTVLVPPQTKLEIPVSCLERGRWGRRRGYTRSDSFAPRHVRHRTAASVSESMHQSGSHDSDQGAVWSAVDEVLAAESIASPTDAAEALHATYRREDSWMLAIEELCRLGPLPGQCGFAVAHGRRIAALELFGSPDLLTVHWKALIRSYLLERVKATDYPSTSWVLRRLRRFGQSKSEDTPGIGLGIEKRVRNEEWTAQALVLNDGLVHASFFME